MLKGNKMQLANFGIRVADPHSRSCKDHVRVFSGAVSRDFIGRRNCKSMNYQWVRIECDCGARVLVRDGLIGQLAEKELKRVGSDI